MNALSGVLLMLFLSSSGSAQAAGSGGALVPVKVKVEGSDRTPPFNRERLLEVPEGAEISVLARVRKARFLAVSPSGDVLVSQPDRGKILIIRRSGSSVEKPHELIGGLRLPQGMLFHYVGNTLYLYVSQSNRISRFIYSADSLAQAREEVVVPDLPDSSSPNLGGAYGHELK